MKTFIFIGVFLVNFVQAMESAHAMHPPLPFNKPLAKFLVCVYSMPKWDKETKDFIKEIKIPELISSSQSIVADKLQNDLDNVNTKFDFNNYSRLINSAKGILIEKIKATIPPEIELFEYVSALKTYLINSHFLANEKEVNKMCSDIAGQITLQQKEAEVEEKHKEIIKRFVNEKLKINIKSIKENAQRGVNVGFIVTIDNGDRYFVKTFHVYQDLDKIDCREIFAYKVLEYLGFGPATHCLIQKFSTSQGSRAKGAYLMTKDVALNDDPENVLSKHFFRDGDNEHKGCYEKAIADQNFKIELFAIASLNKILRLKDTFGATLSNYGIINTIMKDGKVNYEPVLIDHLPYTSNAILTPQYSPGHSLRNLLKEKSSDSNLGSIIVSIEDFSSKSLNLVDAVKKIVTQGKKQIDFEEAVEKSLEYVLTLIEQDEDSFKEQESERGLLSASDVIQKHVRVIKQNYETFLTNYQKLVTT